MHDLNTWAKNYQKKKEKGTYDREKAVKGLTHAVKNSEPAYFGTGHRDHKATLGKMSGATRTAAARHLLPHVEKLMPNHAKAAKPVKEGVDIIEYENLSETGPRKVCIAFIIHLAIMGFNIKKRKTDSVTTRTQKVTKSNIDSQHRTAITVSSIQIQQARRYTILAALATLKSSNT